MEKFPKIYRVGTTLIKRNIYATFLHFYYQTAIYVFPIQEQQFDNDVLH